MALAASCLTRFTLVSVVTGVLVAATAAQAQPGCVATLDGARFAFLLPEHVVWEAVFQKVSDGGVHRPLLSEPGMRALRHRGGEAVQVASALRRASADAEQVSVDIAAAEVTLSARDVILRALSKGDVEELESWLEGVRRGMRFTFPYPGRRSHTGAAFTCPVSVDGRNHPELIPEAFYWEFYFRVLSSIADKHRTGTSTYDPDYLTALRTHHLPIPEDDVVVLLTVAADTIVEVDSARVSSEPGTDAENVAAAIVRRARAALVRSLPLKSWLTIQREAAGKRGGMLYDFPTGE